jgi:hypothetical protein
MLVPGLMWACLSAACMHIECRLIVNGTYLLLEQLRFSVYRR